MSIFALKIYQSTFFATQDLISSSNIWGVGAKPWPSHVAIAECILAYSSASLVSRDFARFRALHVQQLDHVFAIRSPLKRPASVRTCSMWFPVLFRFLAHSLTNVRSLGLRRAVPPLACYRWFRCCSFGDESPDSSSNALRSSQTHETGFKCPSGHGRRENAYRGF